MFTDNKILSLVSVSSCRSHMQNGEGMEGETKLKKNMHLTSLLPESAGP